MVIMYLLHSKTTWILPMFIQIISYAAILRKMGRSPYRGIIPVLGEMEMSRDLFRSMRSFWRPCIVTAALMLTATYLQGREYATYLKIICVLVYGIFVARLYWRLTKQFGKGRVFAVLMILIPIIFLPILAFGKSTYLGRPQFKPEKKRSKLQKSIRNAAIVMISGIEVLVLILVCFGLTVLFRPIRPMMNYMLNDSLAEIASVSESDQYVSREDTIGQNFEAVASAQRSRDYFFADHSGDKKVVVMEYIIGSDLEDGHACASLNIAEMKDATKQGDALEFVIQAGGSRRWFTRGIDDYSVGRYTISDY